MGVNRFNDQVKSTQKGAPKLSRPKPHCYMWRRVSFCLLLEFVLRHRRGHTLPSSGVCPAIPSVIHVYLLQQRASSCGSRSPRLCVLREYYLILTLKGVVPSLSEARRISTFYFASGFSQIKFDEESSRICTWSTSYGRKRFFAYDFWHLSCNRKHPNGYSQSIR